MSTGAGRGHGCAGAVGDFGLRHAPTGNAIRRRRRRFVTGAFAGTATTAFTTPTGSGPQRRGTNAGTAVAAAIIVEFVGMAR